MLLYVIKQEVFLLLNHAVILKTSHEFMLSVNHYKDLLKTHDSVKHHSILNCLGSLVVEVEILPLKLYTFRSSEL